MLSLESELLFNAVSSSMIMESKSDTATHHGRNKKPYVVLRIKKESFLSRNLRIKHDESSKGEIIGSWCVNVEMGQKKIPTNEIELFGMFETDTIAWHTEDKWNTTHILLQATDADYKIEDITIEDGNFSCTYADRYKEFGDS